MNTRWWDSRNRRRGAAPLGSASSLPIALVIGLVCTLIMPGASTGSAANWNDTSKVTVSPVGLAAVPAAPVKSNNQACQVLNVLGIGTARFTWSTVQFDGVELKYTVTTSYHVVPLIGNPGSESAPVALAPVPGAQTTYVDLNAGLLDLVANLLGTAVVTTRVTASYPNAPSWKSPPTVYNSTYTSLGGHRCS